MNISRAFFSFLVLSFTTFVWASTLTVGPSAPYASIQAAVTAAQDGDTIIVKRNGNTPYEAFNVDIDKRLHIMSEPDALTGDFLPGECILDPGTNVGHIFEVTVQALGSDSDITIEGFTFQNGNTGPDGAGVDAFGGAIRIEESRALIRHCIFKGNKATGSGTLMDGGNGQGGAISILAQAQFTGTHATIENCCFLNNEALGGSGTLTGGKGLGGAVSLQNASANFTLCDFISNSSTGGSGLDPETSLGGAVYGSQGGGIFNACRFLSNSAAEAGGFYVESSGGFFTNCVFASNTARSGDGGACYVTQSGSIITWLNSTVASNNAAGRGGAVYVENAMLEVFNSIVWDNTASVSHPGIDASSSALSFKYSDVQGSPWGEFGGNDGGNISSTPFFVGATNFRLQAASPCINSGSNALISGAALDLDGSARTNSGTVDMGAYETNILTFISNIKAAVDAVGSTLPGDGQSLKQKLTQASSAITAGDYSRAINDLNEFISKVNQMVPKKMSAANAAILTAMAQDVINMFLP